MLNVLILLGLSQPLAGQEEIALYLETTPSAEWHPSSCHWGSLT